MVPAEKISACPLTPAERCTQAYQHHLREARGLASATIANYVPFIRRFLEDRFGDGPVTLSHLCAGDVVRFVQRQAPPFVHETKADFRIDFEDGSSATVYPADSGSSVAVRDKNNAVEYLG